MFGTKTLMLLCLSPVSKAMPMSEPCPLIYLVRQISATVSFTSASTVALMPCNRHSELVGHIKESAIFGGKTPCCLHLPLEVITRNRISEYVGKCMCSEFWTVLVARLEAVTWLRSLWGQTAQQRMSERDGPISLDKAYSSYKEECLQVP